MTASTDLEQRIAAFLRTRGSPASSGEIVAGVLSARLGVSESSEDALGDLIGRLIGRAPSLLRRTRAGWDLTPAGRLDPEARLPGPVVIAAADLPAGATLPARLAVMTLLMEPPPGGSVPGDRRIAAEGTGVSGQAAARNLQGKGGEAAAKGVRADAAGPATAVWPGDPPAMIREIAAGAAVLVCGGATERDALAFWLSSRTAAGISPGYTPLRESGPAIVLSLPPLLRRAGLTGAGPASSGPKDRKRSGRRGADRDEEPSDRMTPLERCAAGSGLATELFLAMNREGVGAWQDVPAWLAAADDFDFEGRSFDRSTLGEVPEGPGVYRFFDAEGELVYVGQSRRLRRRVSSYFRATLPPESRQGRIAARVHRIEITTEGSGLAAQVREASEIRRLRPRANTQRTVREREVAVPWRGARLVVLPAANPRKREVFFVRDGQVVDRRSMSAGPAGLRLARTLIARYFFERPPRRRRARPPEGEEGIDAVSIEKIAKGGPGRDAGDESGGGGPADAGHPAAADTTRRPGGRPGISRRSALEAERLLASWTRRQGNRVLSLDPLESPGPEDAARRLIAYLAVDPSDGAAVIR